MKKLFLFLSLFIALLNQSYGQDIKTISGLVEDEFGQPVPVATVKLLGSKKGAITDFYGEFNLNVTSDEGEIEISSIGFITKVVKFDNSSKKLNIILQSSSVGLEEILLVASTAIDRKTPVAASTIKEEEIELKLGTQEFPEILKSTPGIYATRQGGGYGDARVNVRGFESENVAVMINGVPVNDMENGAVYWSNWAGLGDVTRSMQVQRGLGASKVAVPSIGGTINIVTKSTDATEGGNITSSVGNDGYVKYGMTYSTGLSEKGFAATVSAAKISGQGYVDGTEFSGVNYFVSLSKKINEAHELTFSAFGAQQEHGQRYNRATISELEASEAGPQKWNKDWGYKNGQVYHQSYNFYHKPQISLNHYWDINDNTKLSTSAYASFGTGGGRRDEGSKIGADEYRLGASDQAIDFDAIVAENRENGIDGSTDIISASMNTHKWYGILSILKTEINDDLVITGGFDGRYYIGSHWYEVTDLLGGDFYLDNETETYAYGEALKVGDKYNKDYDGIVLRGGFFGQAEYQVNDKLNVFAAADISNTRYTKKEFMNSTLGDNRESDAANFLGFGIKGGGNYNLDMVNNVFVNVGYFSKAPFLTNVFQDEDSLDLNDGAENEKVFSAEVGYGYRSSSFTANVNLYYTQWLDKAISGNLPETTDGDIYYYNILGVDALHQGIELDFKYKFMEDLTLTGMASIGDWRWKNNVSADIYEQDGSFYETVDIFSKDIKVGNAAQTTFALGLSYDFAKKSVVYVDYNYAGNMYAEFDVDSRSESDLPDVWEAPDYGLFDLGLSHSFDFGPFEAKLNGKVNNIFDTLYISDAQDVEGVSYKALVYYGAGRTYSLGLKIKF